MPVKPRLARHNSAAICRMKKLCGTIEDAARPASQVRCSARANHRVGGNAVAATQRLTSRCGVAAAAFRRTAAPNDCAWPRAGLLFWPDGRPWQGAAQGRGRDQVGGSTAESTRPKRQLRVAGRTRDAPPPLDAHQRLVLRLLRFEDYCAAKQYKNPAPPVAIRFCWLQPWLGCTEFQDAFGPPSRSK